MGLTQGGVAKAMGIEEDADGGGTDLCMAEREGFWAAYFRQLFVFTKLLIMQNILAILNCLGVPKQRRIGAVSA